MKATIDIGSNSTLLLVCEILPGGIKEFTNESRVTGLGRGIDQSKEFSAEAMKDTFEALLDYKSILAGFGIGPSQVKVTATEASRVARNAPDFFAKIKGELGFEIIIIGADDEAYYTALGVSIALPANATRQYTLMDVGGASTELITIGYAPFEMKKSISLPFGSVRGLDWDHKGILERKTREIIESHEEELALFRPNPLSNSKILGVAGTVTTISALMQGLSSFEPSKIQGHSFSIHQLESFLAEFKKADKEELLRRFPYAGKRLKTLYQGGYLALTLAQSIGQKDFEVSTYGLRYGTLLAP